MDSVLRAGLFPLFLAYAVLVSLSGDGDDLWRGLANLAAVALFPAIARGFSIRSDQRRTPSPASLFVRRVVQRGRWAIAVLFGAGAAWYSQAHYGRGWLSVLAGAAGAAAAAWAARPLPMADPPPAPPRPQPRTASLTDPYRPLD